jgi:hypothetical protein
MGIAQRRAAKALKRKAVVRAKRAGVGAPSRAPAGPGLWIGAGGVPIGKASAALLDLAAPLIDTIDEEDQAAHYNCLMMAMTAWNLSLIPAEQRKEKLAEIFEDLFGLDDDNDSEGADGKETLAPTFEEAINKLISRKMLLYPFDRRWLLDLDVIVTKDGYRVNVMSSVEPAA